MDIAYAKELLKMLADGVDPSTGEVLPRDDCCNQPDVIRALHVAVRQLENAERRSRRLPENAGKPWTKEDDEKLGRMYDNRRTKREMCEVFKRTEGAISSRLVRIGKINFRDERWED